ncbi:DNA-processing protein DprA [Streptomyces adustus]|uniref:DNA-processing protein DprA n=1 Tax=Streptomyces adustus TaxID=1609272 RepID=UPI0030842855
MARARVVAGGLAGRGVTVVGGPAAGVDTAVRGTALAVGGRTVAVIGTGLRCSCPARSARPVLCRFWPGAPPSKASAPAGLARAGRAQRAKRGPWPRIHGRGEPRRDARVRRHFRPGCPGAPPAPGACGR